MDAIQLLRQQHQNAKTAFGDLERATEPEERIRLWRELRPQLESHEEMEATCLYGPLSREAESGHQRLASWDEEHHRDVHRAQELMDRLDRMDAAGPEWIGTLEQVRISLDAHIELEEKQIFPLVQLVWRPDQLAHAGTQMEGSTSDVAAKTQPPYSMPRTPNSEQRGRRALYHTSAAATRLTELFDGELEFVRQRPGTGLVAAASVGFLLGLLLAWRPR